MDKKHYLTIKAQTSVSTMVKPGELVDVVEMTPLTLADRRIYNLLIENAWEKFYEDFTIEEMRGLLGVPKGKLNRFADLNKYAIKPAVKEVTALSDYGVKIEPITEGRRVVKLRLAWWKKDMNGLKEAFAELQRCKVGRKARINGTVEPITD